MLAAGRIRCQLGDLARGTRYLDDGEELMVTDGRVDFDGYVKCVQLTGDLAGQVRTVRNDVRLVKDRDGRWFVCPVLNDWVQ